MRQFSKTGDDQKKYSGYGMYIIDCEDESRVKFPTTRRMGQLFREQVLPAGNLMTARRFATHIIVAVTTGTRPKQRLAFLGALASEVKAVA